MADPRKSVFCPFHGNWIVLGDCDIVSTSETFNAERGALTAEARVAGRQAVPEQPIGEDALEADDETASPSPRRRQLSVTASRLRTGSIVRSQIDEADRVVLALAQDVVIKRRMSSAVLRRPSEVAESHGPHARPARACPVCRHPLPLSLDHRPPFPITMIGHSGSSKTSTIMALVEEAGRRSEAELGVHSFLPSGAATDYLYKPVVGIDNEGVPVALVTGFWRTLRKRHPPLEFIVKRTPEAREMSLLFQDAAGEDLMDHEAILRNAPSLLWSDVLIYVYDPTRSTKHRGRQAMPQSSVLNRVRDDIENNRQLPYDPTLVVMVSKADTLEPNRQYDLDARRYSDQDVQDILRELGDGAVVQAARRFETVHWILASPQKPPTGDPHGIVPLFRALMTSLPEK